PPWSAWPWRDVTPRSTPTPITTRTTRRQLPTTAAANARPPRPRRRITSRSVGFHDRADRRTKNAESSCALRVVLSHLTRKRTRRCLGKRVGTRLMYRPLEWARPGGADRSPRWATPAPPAPPARHDRHETARAPDRPARARCDVSAQAADRSCRR